VTVIVAELLPAEATIVAFDTVTVDCSTTGPASRSRRNYRSPPP
jgi:hypothetical protein